MVTILLAEDEAALRILTKANLGRKYHLLMAKNGVEALEIFSHEHIDLLIADIMMPEMDGYELVRAIRGSGSTIPVILLTAMNTFEHKRTGFETGIDDYLTKPVNFEELEWHIEALLRRAGIAAAKQIVIGDFELSEETMSASCKGKPIDLTETEFKLLYKLLSYPGVLFTKQQLMDEIWGYDSESDYSTIKTYISRLRTKCAEADRFELVSMRGLGYKAELKGEPK